MTPAELHAAVHAAVTARLELARAAQPHWDDMYMGLAIEVTDAEHVEWVGDLLTLLDEVLTVGERLDWIGRWHSRETGTVGDYCTEWGHTWPCDTRRMAEGTYVDD